MLIPLPLAFGFTKVDFGLTRNGNIARSLYTGAAQRIVFPMAIWEFQGTLVEYQEPEASDIRRFLVGMKGIENSVQMPVPGYNGSSTGYAGPNTVSTSASATRANSVTIKSSQANTPMLIAGEYVTVNGELKVATQNVSTNNVGDATIYFEPPLRKAAPLGSSVVLYKPFCVMHSVDNDVASWGLSAPVSHSVKISLIEDLNYNGPLVIPVRGSQEFLAVESGSFFLLES